MSIKRLAVLSVTAAVTAATAPGLTSVAQAKPLITIDGSSTVFPITEAVAEEFQLENRGAVNVTVGVSGSGGGFKKFCAGETDISNASRPIKQKEIELCQSDKIGTKVDFIEIKVARDALTVVVNKENNAISSMTIADLKKLWSADTSPKITTWDQLYSAPELKGKQVSLYGPGTDSGTFDYFTEEVLGKGGNSRSDYVPSEDDNLLVQGVANDKYSLGYFGYAYYLENKDKIKAVAIDSGNGPVFPSSENVENGKYTPLSRPLFIYVSKQALKKPEVKSFVQYYLNNVEELSAEVGYIPLKPAEYAKYKSEVEKASVLNLANEDFAR